MELSKLLTLSPPMSLRPQENMIRKEPWELYVVVFTEFNSSERCVSNYRWNGHHKHARILPSSHVKLFGLMCSSAGCSSLVGTRPKFKATAIEKLRNASAIILGKENCSEWVNFRAPEKSISGWSAVGGQDLGIYPIIKALQAHLPEVQ